MYERSPLNGSQNSVIDGSFQVCNPLNLRKSADDRRTGGQL